MAQKTAMLGGVMLVFEREGVRLGTNGGSQQEENENDPLAPVHPSCHGS